MERWIHNRQYFVRCLTMKGYRPVEVYIRRNYLARLIHGDSVFRAVREGIRWIKRMTKS